MAKKDSVIRRVEDINEKELLAALAGLGEQERPVENKQKEISLPGNDPDKEEDIISIATSGPAKAKPKNNYKAVFLKPKELKTRQCVYVSMDLHEKIIAIVNEIAVKGMSVGAFIDTVLRQHLEEHKDEINNLYRRKREDLL